MNESPARVARKVRARRKDSEPVASMVRLHSSGLMLILLSLAFSVAAIWILASSFLIVRGPEALIGILIGAAIELIAVIFFILPLLIGNLLTGTMLEIRYGIQFSEEIPLHEIEEIERLDRLPAPSGILGGGIRLGVEYSAFDKRFTVLRSKHGMVRIKLLNGIVIRSWFVPRMVKEIIFDTLDGDKVIKKMDEMRLQGVE